MDRDKTVPTPQQGAPQAPQGYAPVYYQQPYAVHHHHQQPVYGAAPGYQGPPRSYYPQFPQQPPQQGAPNTPLLAVEPRLSYCGIVALAIFSVLGSMLTLVVDKWGTAAVVLFAGSFFVGLWGMARRSPSLFRANYYYSIGQLPLIALTVLFVLVDYHDKCSEYENLSQRVLQDAYSFDCEAGGVVGIVFWTVAMIIYFCIALGYMFMSRSMMKQLTYIRSMRARALHPPGAAMPQPVDAVNSPQSPPAEPALLSRSMQILGVTAIVVGIIVLFVASFQNRSHKVSGTCPATPAEAFFVEPEINDLGCCTWLKAKGTCCQQRACDMKVNDWLNTDDDGDNKCSDQMGLLSCAPCRRDGGLFASDLSSVVICSDWCAETWRACDGESQGYSNSTQWCENVLTGVQVASSPDQPCFNAGIQVIPSAALILASLFAMTLSSIY